MTLILIACGVPITSTGTDPRAIDIDHLRRCEILEHGMVGEFYRYRFEHPSNKRANIFLPCTKATNILGGENIDFEPEPIDENVHIEGATKDEIDET